MPIDLRVRQHVQCMLRGSLVGVKPAIAQLVEHLTVELAEIRWSLVRFRVAGFA